jgi:hypothetical protein
MMIEIQGKLSWYLNKNGLSDDFEVEKDATRQKALANAYKAITD